MRKWKRGLGVVLALTMVMGLSACGLFKGNGNDNSNKNNNSSSGSSDLAKQYVYRMEEYDFSGIQKEGVDSYVQSIQTVGDKLYMVMTTYNYTENGSNTQYSLVSLNLDGSDMKTSDIKYSLAGDKSAGNNAEENGQGSEVNPESDAETALDTGAEVAVDVDLDVDYGSNVYENTSLSDFQFDGDRVWGIKNYYYEDYSDPDNYVSVNQKYICAWDMDGNLLWETLLDLPTDENQWYSINSLVSRGDGTVMALINGAKIGTIDVDEEGNASELKSIEGLEKYMEKSGSIAATPSGDLLITYYDDSWTTMNVVTYDFKRNYVGEGFPLPASVSSNIGRLNVDANGDLIYTNNLGVYKYHIGDDSGTQIMSFVNSDLDISYLSSICPIDEDHFVGIYSKYDEEKWYSSVVGGLFTRVPPEDIPDKQVLVLGGNYIGGDIRTRVIEYNKSSNTHRIVLRDYREYSTSEDYNAGITQLNNDIISGNMPDILVVDGYSMTLDNYISKGLLADVGKLIEEDEELSKVEFMENVFEACKVDGKLYEIIPSFSVQTYIAKKSLVGDPADWSMEDARSVLAAMPEGASMFGDTTRPFFFTMVMQICGNDFIDVSTGKCNFDSPEFIALMEYAKELPEELGEDYYSENWYEAYQSQYRENRTLLSSCYIYDIESLVYTINGSFGEDVSYVGFPSSSGQGSVINTSTTYALAAKSSDLEEAWNFMRYYLTDEYQKDTRWMLPVHKKYFDERAEKATKKPTYEDENGKEVEDDYTWWFNDESIILDPLTQEQLQEVKDFISSVNTRVYYNNDVEKIITEEMDAFYQGQKSAKDVAGIIQSRAQLFVNENR